MLEHLLLLLRDSDFSSTLIFFRISHAITPKFRLIIMKDTSATRLHIFTFNPLYPLNYGSPTFSTYLANFIVPICGLRFNHQCLAANRTRFSHKVQNLIEFEQMSFLSGSFLSPLTEIDPLIYLAIAQLITHLPPCIQI